MLRVQSAMQGPDFVFVRFIRTQKKLIRCVKAYTGWAWRILLRCKEKIKKKINDST